MTKKLTKEEIDAIKRKRASEKRLMIDKLRLWVGIFSVPSIMIMVGTLVASAYFLKSEALAVVTGLVSTVTLGLINVLQQMTAPPEKESDARHANDNLTAITDKLTDNAIAQKPMKIKLNDKSVQVGDNGTECKVDTEADEMYGYSDVPTDLDELMDKQIKKKKRK